MEASQSIDIIHPLAPRARPVDLPQYITRIDEESLSLKRDDEKEILPNDILLRSIFDEGDYPSGLHRNLSYTETPRPIVGTQGAIGAVFDVQDIATPATKPPTARMTVGFIDGGTLIVTPTEERSFVSVYDIQMAILTALEKMEGASDGFALGKIIHRIEAWNGSEVDVCVWIWKGLSRRSGAEDIWDLCWET